MRVSRLGLRGEVEGWVWVRVKGRVWSWVWVSVKGRVRVTVRVLGVRV